MSTYELRDGTDPEQMEVELDPTYNEVTELIEIFLDQPHNTPASPVDICSPRIVLTLEEAWSLWYGLGRALGPNPRIAPRVDAHACEQAGEHQITTRHSRSECPPLPEVGVCQAHTDAHPHRNDPDPCIGYRPVSLDQKED